MPLNPSVPPEDRARLARKYDEVIARLKQGPATGVELNAICFGYGQRLEVVVRRAREIREQQPAEPANA